MPSAGVRAILGAMRAFQITLAPAAWAALVADAEARYPREACGLGLGPPGAVTEALALENVQDALHRADPVAHPRTARDAFVMDEQAVLRCLLDAEARGLELGLVYHAHCDAGPHLSDLDAASAALWPGVIQVVLSVVGGVFRDAVAYRPAVGAGFDAARLWPPDAAG